MSDICSKKYICMNYNKFPNKENTKVDGCFKTETIKVHFDFAAALESVYPILEIVFSYLNLNDLKSASLVKNSWKSRVKRILEKRDKISWFTISRFGKVNSEIHRSANFGYNNVKLGIIVFRHKEISLKKYFCRCKNGLHKRVKFSEILEEIISYDQDVVYCILHSSYLGSLFLPQDHSQKEMLERPIVKILESCLIPKIPNINVSTFFFDFDNMKRDDYIQSNNEQVKCLLLFCKDNLEDNEIYTIFKYLNIQAEKSRSVALGGGVLYDINLLLSSQFDFKAHNNNNLCILFTQEVGFLSDFNAFSLVIQSYEKEKFENELVKFKQTISLRHSSLALLIKCAAYMDNFESHSFSKVFPEVPILGFDVRREIGWNCYNADDEEENFEISSKKRKRRYLQPLHQFSAVVVIITWGKLHILSQE